MLFHFKADVLFDAENLDDAFRKLAGHLAFLEGEQFEMLDWYARELNFKSPSELTLECADQ